MTRYNGEYWYEEKLATAILQWFCWPGGYFAHRNSRFGWTWRQRARRRMLTPISFLGGRLVVFSWGWQLRVRDGYLVSSMHCRKRQVYWSRNGTPEDATVWLLNAPAHLDVKR